MDARCVKDCGISRAKSDDLEIVKCRDGRAAGVGKSQSSANESVHASRLVSRAMGFGFWLRCSTVVVPVPSPPRRVRSQAFRSVSAGTF